MKTAQILILLCVAGGVALAQTDPTAPALGPETPPHGSGISDIVGAPTNRWDYAWPHHLVPDAFAGFRVKSSPVDRTKTNEGRTMQNWGHPVEVTNSTARVAITCRRDYPPVPGGQDTAEPFKPRPAYAAVDFHGLPAGLASAPSGAAITMYFAFRLNDVVFDLTARGKKETSCKASLLAVAEQIWRFNTKESPTTPPTVPSPAPGAGEVR
jgi:hypothetical protein